MYAASWKMRRKSSYFISCTDKLHQRVKTSLNHLLVNVHFSLTSPNYSPVWLKCNFRLVEGDILWPAEQHRQCTVAKILQVSAGRIKQHSSKTKQLLFSVWMIWIWWLLYLIIILGLLTTLQAACTRWSVNMQSRSANIFPSKGRTTERHLFWYSFLVTFAFLSELISVWNWMSTHWKKESKYLIGKK